jgi:hypothetical protein
MRSVIPRPPNPSPQYNPQPSYPTRYLYRPPCPQYNSSNYGGIVVNSNSVYGTCSPNQLSPYDPPYDFVCDRNGRNCVSPTNLYGQSYPNINSFCCNAGNAPPYVPPGPPPRPPRPPGPPPRPNHSQCCRYNVNECAKCLTNMGVVTNSNPTVNHFSNMTKCKKMCNY